MSKKSFILGFVAGVIFTFVGLLLIGYARGNAGNDIQYLEQPVSYENKAEASFQVFQVLGEAALANEGTGLNTVLILGEDFYTDQKITLKNPLRVGTYSYTSKGGRPMTVPVLQGE